MKEKYRTDKKLKFLDVSDKDIESVEELMEFTKGVKTRGKIKYVCHQCHKEVIMARNRVEAYTEVICDWCKRKKSCEEIYGEGITNPNKSRVVREKIEKTNMERYGVPYPSQCKEVVQKAKDTISKDPNFYKKRNEKIKENNKKNMV